MKGKTLEVRYFTNSSSVLETTTQQMIIERALATGFRLKVVSFEGVFFGDLGACPRFHMAITGCALVLNPDPSITARLGFGSIPTLANQYVGMNQIGWCNQEADRLMKESDRELDPAKRLALLDRVYELEANDMIGLPLFVVPATVGWRTDMIAGPIGEWNSSPYSAFFNMNEWHLR